MTSGYGMFIGTPVIGAGSAITTVYGLRIADQTGGGTNYAIKTGAGLLSFGDAATFAGTVAVTGLTDVSSTIRATSSGAPAAGAGVEVDYGSVAANSGRIFAYDRTGVAFKAMYVSGLDVKLDVNGGNLYIPHLAGGGTRTLKVDNSGVVSAV